MLIIPAIDLIDGQCVRLLRGDYGHQTVFDRDPVAVARRWEDQGARRLHLVDLDGAREGRPANLKVIEAIANAISIPVELGGGLRTLDHLKEAADAGVAQFVLGTTTIRHPELAREMVSSYPNRIWIGIDARQGTVSVAGWREGTEISAAQLAADWNDSPIMGFIVTDISKDGTLKGPGMSLLTDVLEVARRPVIASGGVAAIEDLIRLRPLSPQGLGGVIVGMALYTGAIDLKEAIRAVE